MEIHVVWQHCPSLEIWRGGSGDVLAAAVGAEGVVGAVHPGEGWVGEVGGDDGARGKGPFFMKRGKGEGECQDSNREE